MQSVYSEPIGLRTNHINPASIGETYCPNCGHTFTEQERTEITINNPQSKGFKAINEPSKPFFIVKEDTHERRIRAMEQCTEA
jgi:uncharacterized Zn finger protein (UPF0148 family)